jgi:hypothetical protein
MHSNTGFYCWVCLKLKQASSCIVVVEQLPESDVRIHKSYISFHVLIGLLNHLHVQPIEILILALFLTPKCVLTKLIIVSHLLNTHFHCFVKPDLSCYC